MVCVLARSMMDFDTFYELYADRIYNTVYRILGDAEEALDAVQQAFMRAHKAWDKFREASSRYTWVYRIAINCAYTQLKKRRRRQEMEPASIDADEGFDVAVGRENGVADEVGRKEMERIVQAAIGRLPEDVRGALVLRDIDGLSYEEIADVLEIPVGTVKSRVHRARELLKGMLERILGREFVEG